MKTSRSHYRFFKRMFDIAGALAGMLMLAGIFPWVAAIIKMDSKGPIFFAQTRVGLNGRKFKFFKFRTMVMDAHLQQSELDTLNETNGITFKMSGDPRITRIGKYLRKSSLDETPQFWNVLKGDMSLIGPRPPLVDEVERYDTNQLQRLSVPQGMTGLWQVRGRSRIEFEQMVDLDNYYAENASILLDLKILLFTIPTVLLGRGAR